MHLTQIYEICISLKIYDKSLRIDKNGRFTCQCFLVSVNIVLHEYCEASFGAFLRQANGSIILIDSGVGNFSYDF